MLYDRAATTSHTLNHPERRAMRECRDARDLRSSLNNQIHTFKLLT
jgi:hypothetical protein